MALSVSEQMQQRKQQKFKRELERTLSSTPAKNLEGFVSDVFEFHTYKPTPDHFVNMTLASKFGTGNSVAEGGVAFFLETALWVFNEANNNGLLPRAKVQPWGSAYALKFSTLDVWNAAFILEVDSKLLPHIPEFEPDDLVWAEDISPFLFIDKETRAFGFVIVALPPMTVEEFKEYGSSIVDFDESIAARFIREGFARYQILQFDTGQMEYVSAVRIQFGPIDKLIACLPDRERHDVTSHERKLQSGSITTVRAHNRRTPIRMVVNNRVLTDHIVYCVKDADNYVRYFGEGKRDRWKHVNSGVSHNWKINEHYFTKGEMSVEVLHEGLTKSEALSIERMLIRKGADSLLWNVKDYEPFRSIVDQQISNEEIEEFADHNKR